MLVSPSHFLNILLGGHEVLLCDSIITWKMSWRWLGLYSTVGDRRNSFAGKPRLKHSTRTQRPREGSSPHRISSEPEHNVLSSPTGNPEEEKCTQPLLGVFYSWPFILSPNLSPHFHIL